MERSTFDCVCACVLVFVTLFGTMNTTVERRKNKLTTDRVVCPAKVKEEAGEEHS